MTTFEWSVGNTDYTLVNGQADRITTSHWQCAAMAGEGSERAYGTVSVDLPASSSEAEVLAATQAVIVQAPDVTLQQATEASLESRLVARAEPTSASGRPWEYPASATEWKAGEAVSVDDVRLFNGAPYTAIQAHTTQLGWEPPNVPALWSIQDQGPDPVEWVAGEAVSVGDRRIYEGITYEVIQAHTTQVGWEPPNVPALWREV